MAEVIVVGAFTAKSGSEREAQELMQTLVAPTHGEDGCIMYALHVGSDDPRRLAFIERWASREALDTHLKSDHIAAALAHVDDLFDVSDITVYEPLGGGEPTKGTIAGHAGG